MQYYKNQKSKIFDSPGEAKAEREKKSKKNIKSQVRKTADGKWQLIWEVKKRKPAAKKTTAKKKTSSSKNKNNQDATNESDSQKNDQ